MIHLLHFANQMIDTLYLTSSDLYGYSFKFESRISKFTSFFLCLLSKFKIKKAKQDGLSCSIRTINTTKTCDFSCLFNNYSNNLFSYWRSYWFV